jgi:hypothetical protein
MTFILMQEHMVLCVGALLTLIIFLLALHPITNDKDYPCKSLLSTVIEHSVLERLTHELSQ